MLDLPGVNAQESTRERLIESDTIMTTIEIPMPHWAEKAGARSWNISMSFSRTLRKPNGLL